MRGWMQLGLFCLSLLISSLHGEQTDKESSIEQPPNFTFEQEDLHQYEVSENELEPNHLSHDYDIMPVIHRVRQQSVSAEKEFNAKKEVFSPLSSIRTKRQENAKVARRKRPPRIGGLTPLGDSGVPQPPRAKRQNNDRKQRKKPKPGKFSILASLPKVPTSPEKEKITIA
ncbi:uncharacterized protein si:ch211-106h4.12 [Myxocyprinus asiaticus]|uniref:uncharacterized protein si:ch211-106h4.12 n=1 Tax=Myxocyprinus asiaticus TaxID=70543 RepID=UPI002223182B|nr:uncharacterized protein si:ch211-106h4.12 [Myxocyprinus asiaticus]